MDQQLQHETPSPTQSPIEPPTRFPVSSKGAPPKKRIKWLLVTPLALIVILGAIYSFNYIGLQTSMNEVLKDDPRNRGIDVNAHYQNYVNMSVLVYDLRALSDTNSKADVFRAFLQFASKMKERKFEKVELAFRGQTKFILSGDYFQELGLEYGYQNPIWTINHFPENLRLRDGTRAYGTWTGGWLGVAGKQMEDFNDFQDEWYMHDLLTGR
jgi:hypothetical protein